MLPVTDFLCLCLSRSNLGPGTAAHCRKIGGSTQVAGSPANQLMPSAHAATNDPRHLVSRIPLQGW